MADASLTLSAWNAGEPVAVDDNATDSVPYTKLMFGPSGTRTHVEAAAGLPVTPDSGGFAVTVSSGTITADLGANNDVTVTSGAITETNSTAILADTASMDTNLGTIAAVDFATQTTLAAINAKLVTGTVIGDVNLGATDNAVLDAIAASVAGTLTVGSHAVTNAGTFVVQEDGAALTALQLIDDAIFADSAIFTPGTDKLIAIGGAVLTGAPTYTTGDVAALSLDTSGALRVTGSSGSTQYAEDAPHTSGNTGTMALVVRNDTLAALAGTDGDYAPLQVDASGALYVTASAGSAEVVLGTATYTEATSAGVTVATVRRDADTPLADTTNEFAPFITDANGYLKVNVKAGSAAGTEYTLGTATYAEATSAGGIAAVVRSDAGGSLVNADNEITALQVDSAGALRVTGGGGGTEYTEDVPTANPIVGTATLMERDDALTTVTPIQGDWISFRGTAEGALWVQDFNSDAALTFLTQIDADTSNINTNINTIASAIKVSGTATYTETSTEALVAGAVRNDAGGTLVNTTNEIGPLQMDSAGNLRVNIAAGGTAGPTDTEDDAVAAGQSAGLNMALAYVHDGTDWSRAAAGTGVRTLQTQRVTIATDDLVPITAASLPLPTGAATETTLASILSGQLADGHGVAATLTAETTKVIGTVNIAAAQTIGITANSSVNVAQMNGVATTMGNGASGTGVQRVTLASDSTGQVTLAAGTAGIGKLTANSGVDIGDVDVTSIAAGTNLIGNVGIGVRTTGGATPAQFIDVDETEDEVKGSAGQLYWIHAINLAATTVYLKVYNNTAAGTTVGTTTPVQTYPVPPNSTTGGGFVMVTPMGMALGTGITIAGTTGVAVADTGAPAANSLVVNVGYA